MNLPMSCTVAPETGKVYISDFMTLDTKSRLVSIRFSDRAEAVQVARTRNIIRMVIFV